MRLVSTVPLDICWPGLVHGGRRLQIWRIEQLGTLPQLQTSLAPRLMGTILLFHLEVSNMVGKPGPIQHHQTENI
jgi:hypothetical protein